MYPYGGRKTRSHGNPHTPGASGWIPLLCQSCRREKYQVNQQSGEHIVAVVGCGGYGHDEVRSALKKAVDLVEESGQVVISGEHILLKPNLLQGMPPEQCVNTHPEVLAALAELLIVRGCRVIIADSPGGGIRYTVQSLKKAYAGAGYDRAALDTGADLNFDCGFEIRSFPEGRVSKQFPLISPALSTDGIVVASKAKTHILTLITGSSKNLFGLVPGLEKPMFHSRFHDPALFAGMIVDLNEMVKPRLHIIDAVTGMEGDGPTSGTPRKIGVILAGTNAFALDSVLCRLMSIDPAEVPVLAEAIKRGHIKADSSDIRIIGDPVGSYIVEGYRKPSTYLGKGKGMHQKFVFRALHHLGKIYTLRPSVDRYACTRCGKCQVICPKGAIRVSSAGTEIDLSKCIRCYCCHEMCTSDAIHLKRGIAGTLLHKIVGE
jgi:uncharacterized protein (DUF362 family)/Pyruvate/2-oxoacid:ferredoxin oxidoreductase delta subunit